MIAIQRYCRGHQPRFFVMMLDVASLHLIILFHLLTTANAAQSFLLPDYDTTNNNNSNTYSLSEMSASDITAESAEVLSSSLPPAPAPPPQQRTTSDDSSSAQSDDDSVQGSSQSNLTTSSLESSDFTSEILSSSNQQQQQHSSSLKPATIQQFSAASSVINEDAKIKKLNQLQASLSDKECQPKMDVIFVLDTSGSIEQVYAEHIRWTLALVDALPVNRDRVRIAAIQYAGFPLTEFALGTYFSANDIRQHLSQITFQSGVTRTGYALRKADSELFREQRGARANATKIIVLFTDGLSIDDPLKPAHQLRDVKNVKIYVVSVGSDGFEPEMNRIAGDKRNVFGPNDLSRLRDRLLIDAQQAGHCDSIPKQKESSSISRTSLAKSASSSSSSSVSSASSSSLSSSASSASHTSSSSSSFVESSVSALSSASSSSVSSSSSTSTSKRLIQSDSKKQQQMGKETITKKSSNLLLSDLTSSDGSKTASASATATAIKTQTRTRSSSRDHSLNAQSKYLTQIKTISRQQQQQQQTAMINNESSAEDGIESTISTTYRHENLHNQHNTKNADHRNNNNHSSDNYNNNNNNNDDSNKNSSENEEDKSNEKSDFTTAATAAIASDEEDEEEAVKETTTIHQSTIPTTNNDSPSSSSQSVDLEADHGSESLSMPTKKAAASTQQLESEPATSTTTLSDESALNNEAAAQSKQQQQHSISDTASIGNSNSNAHPSYSSSNSNVAQKKSSNDAWKELDDESSSTELNGEDVDQQLVKSIKQNDQNHLNTSSNQPTSFVHQTADHLQSELEAADLQQQQQNNDHTAAITITPASAAAAASTATTEDDQQGDIDAANESNLSSKISSDNQILISSTGEHRYDEISGEHLPEHEQVNLLASASFKKPPSDVKEEFKRNQLTTTQQHNSEEDSSVKSTLHNKTKNAVSSKKALKMESSSNANQLNSTVEEMNAFSSFSLASTQQQQKNSKSAAAQRDDESSGGDSKESLRVTSTATPLSSESSEDLPSQDHGKSSNRAIQSASKSKSALSSSQSSSNTRTNSSNSSRESIDSEDQASEDQLVNANENAEKLLNKTDENELQQQKKSSQRITTNMNTAHRNANDNDDNNGDNDNRQQSSSSTLNNPSSSALASSSSSTSKSSTSNSKTAAQSAKSHSSSKQQLSLKSKSSSMIKSASAAASKHTNTVTAALNSLKKSNSKSAEAASASAINKQSQLDTQTKLEHLLTSHMDETKNIHKITIPTEKNTQNSSEEDEVEVSSTAPFIESAEQTDDESSKINESSIQGSQGASPSQAHSTPHSIAHHHSKQQKQKQSKSSAKSKPQKLANEASNQAVAATIHRASSTPRVPSKETTPSVQARTPPIPRRVTKKHRKANNATNRRNGSANAGVVCPLDFLFIVDSSGSVQSIYYKQKQYLTSILSEIQVGEQRVALLQFAGGSHQKTEWTFDTFHDGEAVMEAFANVRHFTGTTYIGRALEASFDLLQLRRNSVPTIVVLLSDGFSQDDATEPAERIRHLANVDFYTVSISDLSNYAYMVELTDDPEKVFVGGEQSEHLKELLLKKVNCR